MMRKGILLLMAFLAAMLYTGNFAPFADAATTSRVAVIKEMKGSVLVTKSGGSKQFKAFSKMSLNEGDVLTTGAGSTAVLQFANGTSEDDKISMSANTTLTFSKLSDRKGTRTKVSMFNGTAWVDVKSIVTKDDEFTLETPTVSMGVRGTHLLASVDPVSGSTRLSVVAGVVSASVAGNSASQNVLPNQDAMFTEVDEDVSIAPTDLSLLMAQSDSSVVEAILKAAGDIVKENEEKKDLYVQQSGSQNPEDQDRLKSNVENLLGAIVDHAVKSGLISQDRANALVVESQAQTGVAIDLSKKEITLSEAEKRNQEEQRKKEEDAKAAAETQRKKEEEERKKNDELLKKLEEERKKKEEANKQAEKEKQEKAAAEYTKQLDDTAKMRFEGDKAKREQEQQSTAQSPSPSPTTSPTPSTNKIVVNFQSNGGTTVPSQLVVRNASAAQPSAPTKLGYAFAGWYSDSDLTQSFDFKSPITADITLYAKWNINSYTLSFDSNGGSAVASQTVNYNSPATRPSDPTRAGYSFAGWFSDSGLTQSFDFKTPITADITLYAKWTGAYTLNFDSNGGSAVASRTVNYNSPATQPSPDPTRTGYGFAGWYSDSGLTQAFDFSTPITADITLYAKWQPLLTLVNAGFEEPVISGFQYAPDATGWTFSGNYSGIEHNGSAFGAAAAPEGGQAAILQMSGSFSQDVAFSAGTYNIGFKAASRGGNNQLFDVRMDSTVIGSFVTTSSTFGSFITNDFTVSAGMHTLTFVGKTTADQTAFIDDVMIYETTAGEVAAGITSVAAPIANATSLTLPGVPDGFTVAIYSSSNTGVIGTNGAVAPQATALNVDLVFTVTRTSDGNTANTGAITVMVPPVLPNLAAGIAPTTSDTFQYPSRITDGNKSDWSDGGSGVRWVQLDLGASYDIQLIKLWHYYAETRSYHDVIVQLSNTSDFTSGVTTVFNNDSDNSLSMGAGTDAEYVETSAGKNIVFAPITARYVRFWSNGSTANTANHYVEVEVYGTASS